MFNSLKSLPWRMDDLNHTAASLTVNTSHLSSTWLLSLLSPPRHPAQSQLSPWWQAAGSSGCYCGHWVSIISPLREVRIFFQITMCLLKTLHSLEGRHKHVTQLMSRTHKQKSARNFWKRFAFLIDAMPSSLFLCETHIWWLELQQPLWDYLGKKRIELQQP